MPRLIKKKRLDGEGDGERIIGGDVQERDSQDVDNLQKNKRLLMLGKLPTLTPRSDLGEFPSPVEVADEAGDFAMAMEANQRCVVELGEEEATGFRRRLSLGAKRSLMEEDSSDVPARQRLGFSGAKKAMSDRLTGQRSQVQRGSISGQFRDGPEKEAGGHFTKMRILALNESSSDDSESEVEMESSKEAQEAEAYALYNKALDLQRAGNNAEAETVYHQLLNIPLLAEVEAPEDDTTVMNPGLMLKYSTHKNLGSMSYQKKDLNTAMKHYLEAVSLDETDVTVWYRMGTIAVSLFQLPLARLSFMQALKCSPKHWPSLDKLCTVLYALNDYSTCLYYVCQALEKDRNYRKGVVLHEKIFKEQPSLRKDSYDLFRNCQDVVHPSKINKAEAEKIIKEALKLREERRALAKKEPLPLVKFLTPFTSFASFTWKGLGERLVNLYDHLANSPPPLSICCKIDLREFVHHPEEKENMTSADTTQDTTQENTQSGSRATQVRSVEPDKTISPEQAPLVQSGLQTPLIRTLMEVVEQSTPKETETQSTPMETSEAVQAPQHTPMETVAQHTPKEDLGPTPSSSLDTPMETSVQSPQTTERSINQTLPETTQEILMENALLSSQQPLQHTSDGLSLHQSLQQSSQAEQTLVETSQQTLHETSQLTIQETSVETSHPPKETSQQTTHQSSQPTTQQTLLESSQLTTEQSSQPITQQSPQQSSQRSPQQTSQRSPQQSSQRSPQQSTEMSSQQTTQQSPQQITSMSSQQSAVKSSDMDDSATMETEQVLPKKKNRRGPKRKREKAENPVPGNRRSTRVRNTVGKKKEESVNYQEILRQFLPSSLQESGDSDDIDDTECGPVGKADVSLQPTSAASKTETTDQVQPIGSHLSDASQSEDVWSFLATRQRNSGITQILHEYLQAVAALPGTWPAGLGDVFIQGYTRSRRHVILPNLFSSEYSSSLKTSIGFTMLMFAELKLDQVISAGKSTPSKKADLEVMGKFIDEDMGYIQMLTTSGSILEERWRDFAVRVYWLKARYVMLQGKSDDAIDAFGVCTDILSGSTVGVAAGNAIVLYNCTSDNRITVDLIQDQLKSTQHSQSLEEVQRLYDAAEYKRVTDLLLPTFQDASSSHKMLKEAGAPQRPSQLLLLNQSLLKLNDCKQCIVCGSASIIEALQEVSVAKTTLLRDEWISAMMELLSIINKALCEDISSLNQLQRPQRVRFTSAIISAIEMSMDTESSFPSDVLPWVVLYRLIKHEEDQIVSKEIGATTATQDGGGRSSMIPSSLMLLDTAHDYLGRRSWCCNSGGAFLRLYISVLSREIATGTEEEPHPFLSDLQYSLEQCFFCLHGHPSKKTKARHLQDHGVDELPMDLEDASIIFNHFKPSVLPEFDSYKTSSMSGDLESLLLKIVRIIPPMEDPPVTMETLQAYIEEKTEIAPLIPKDRPIVRPVVKEIYYLLADFYFKNKEFFKAIKLYMQDICVCSERLDSWAGMALARSGRLELKFNTCDSKMEGTIYKHSVAALRCFQRALEIDNTNRSLWIEYGSMAYMVHSYASRQLKQKEQFSLTDDIVEFLLEKQSECLGLAEKCFQEALRCEVDGEEEEWLVHYMLGKVSEKRQKNPEEFLEHYKKAGYYLYEDEAKYPKRIAYHNPPGLSLEALEMFFRLHASILKLLEKRDGHFHGDYKMLQRYVMEAVDEPFVTAQEKSDNSDLLSSADNDADTKSPIPGTIRGQSEVKGQHDVKGQDARPKVPGSPLFVATPTDHDYVRSRGRKRQLSKKTQDDPSSESLAPSHPEQTSSSSLLPSDGKDSISSTSSAAELLKSFAKIHSDNLDQMPAEKKQRLESPAGLDSVKNDAGTSTKPESESDSCQHPPEGSSQKPLAEIQTGSIEQQPAETRQDQISSEASDMETSAGMEEGRPSDPDGGKTESSEQKPKSSDDQILKLDDSSKMDGIESGEGSNKNQERTGRNLVGTDQVLEGTEDNPVEPLKMPEGLDRHSVEPEKNREEPDRNVNIPAGNQGEPDTKNPQVPERKPEEPDDNQEELNKNLEGPDTHPIGPDTNREELDRNQEGPEMHQKEPEKTPEPNTNQEGPDKCQDISDKSQDPEGHRKIVEGPTKSPEEPNKVQEEPNKVQGEPNKVQEEPNKVQEEPNKVQEEPNKVQEEPNKVQEEPKKVQEEPNKVQEEPNKVQEEPIKVHKEAPKVQEELNKDPGGPEKNREGPDDQKEKSDAQSQEDKRAWLMEKCLDAMKLCLSRFPQHYKSLYRMAHAYSTAGTHKSLQWSRDLLLGSSQPWQQTDHMPSPGLFAEHWKTKNLFHGVWRIPISEIDRSGSFSWHMYRSVSLLIDVLQRLKDHNMLLQIAVKLNRTPELGKKFLRDVDRQYLAKHCYKVCLEVLAAEIKTVNETGNKEEQLEIVMSSYRLVQTVQNKLQIDPCQPTKLLCLAFCVYKGIQMSSDVAVLDQAVRFCLQHRSATKTPQTPTSQQEMIFTSP